MNKATLLVKGFNAFVRHNPSYEMPDLTHSIELSSLRLIAGPIQLAPSVDSTILSLETVLAEIVAETDSKIREDIRAEPVQLEIAEKLDSDQAVYEPEPDLLAIEVNVFLSQCLDGNAHSAKEYHFSKSPDWSFEAWLYCLLNRYSYLDEGDKAIMYLKTVEIPHPHYSGNDFIVDVRIGIIV